MTKDEIKKEALESFEAVFNDIYNLYKEKMEALFEEKNSREPAFKLPSYFQTYGSWKQEAGTSCEMLQSKKLYALLKLQLIADRLNGNWVVTYDDSQRVYYIRCDPEYFTVCYTYNKTVGAIYFQTEEKAEIALEIMGDDIAWTRGSMLYGAGLLQ